MNPYSTRTSWIVIILFILAGIAVSTCAHADWYGIVSAGHSTAQLADSSGVVAWQQPPYPHWEDNDSTAWSLGVGYTKSWLSGELRYNDLGRVAQYGEWMNDDNGGPDPQCPCKGFGRAHVSVVSLTGIARYRLGNWSAGVEAGAGYWRAPWSEYVTFDGAGYQATHYPVKDSGIGPVVGAVVSYKRFDVRYTVYHVEPRDGNFNNIVVVSAGMRF